MDILTAHHLLLMTLDPVSGRLPKRTEPNLDAALSGAVLVQLVLGGDVEVRWSGDPHRQATFAAVPDDPDPRAFRMQVGYRNETLANPILGPALLFISRQELPTSVAIDDLGSGLRQHLLEDLAGAGMIGPAQSRSWFGAARTDWPAADATNRNKLHAAARRQLIGELPPDMSTAVVITLLETLGCVHTILGSPGVSDQEVVSRANVFFSTLRAPDGAKHALDIVKMHVRSAAT